MPKKIYIIAGEASGDLHGANLIKALRAISKEPLEIHGVGGQKIKETGVLGFLDLAHFHATGITDAIARIPQYRRAAKQLLSEIKNTGPALVVLIDNPGFNLHLAGKIHAMGIPLVYYIAPQLWAWAPKRILKIKKTIKKVLVVFEFEKKLYEDSGIPVSWVGHPLKDIVEVGPSEDTGKKKQICLMPGSRADEVKKLLPIFLGAAERIRSALPHYSFVLIESPTLTPAHYEKLLKRSSLPDLSVISADAYAHIEQSELALVCSGTATLECALLKTPMIICNRASFFTYLIAKNVIRVPYLGLPNLVLNGPKFPEFLQYQATPQKIAESALKILSNPSMKKSMQENLDNVSQKLGTRGASIRAAQEILKEIA